MSRISSIFSQLLQLFPRLEFYKRAHSLREITNGLRSCEGKLKHLGIAAPNRSTLAYANEHRPWELYQEVFFALLSGRSLCLETLEVEKVQAVVREALSD